MILVDTSLWIDWLRNSKKKSKSLEARADLATCGPVLQEVIQGLQRDVYGLQVREGLLALPTLENPISSPVYLEAADIFYYGRRRGYTIRSSIDCLIAAIAIRHSVPVAHRDRDFDHIAKYTRLEVSDL